ncbi:TetR/AcrR family transcriptional regulator [Sporosarcina koreensis]|uniref:TetR/AcrR family transcriptional regulator n=1 Tax=Sporosarcina koreensis TaxID=334735 RepID=UPI00058F12B0|nr:TetR/AcrR family transcriptional regulator [Sporosarcina koreensis]
MRERIMRGFLEEVQETSMKFTMDDLAKRLGISKRTLYEHFSSKGEILDAIIDTTLREFDEKTAAILADDSLPLLEKIRSAITVVPTYNEFYTRQILEQMKKSFPDQWRRVDAALNEWDEVEELIRQGMAEGLIADRNVPLLMKLIIEAANATLDKNFFLRNHISSQEALEEIVDVLLYGIARQPDR